MNKGCAHDSIAFGVFKPEANRGFSRDVTPSRVCLVTPLIRHFGGQAFGLVCAVCIVMRCR